MKVSDLIMLLGDMPQDAEVEFYEEDFGPFELSQVWLSKSGRVYIAPDEQQVFCVDDEPHDAVVEKELHRYRCSKSKLRLEYVSECTPTSGDNSSVWILRFDSKAKELANESLLPLAEAVDSCIQTVDEMVFIPPVKA